MAKFVQDNTSGVPTDEMGQVVDQLMSDAKGTRHGFERRWYDNNFFDDGYHFRYVSRTANKVVDLSNRESIYTPMRAIPKASRQIRGVSSLLMANDPIPVIYPEKINSHAFADVQELAMALRTSKDEARKVGHFVMEEFKEQDLRSKLSQMILLAAKHSVSWLQVWPDPVLEKIHTQVYDAFDIYCQGDVTDVSSLPYIGKGVRTPIATIKANELFDVKQLEKIRPDNKRASSEIKDAYMTSRYGRGEASEQVPTLILKEFFFKEYLNSKNMDRVRRQDDGEKILRNRKEGDVVLRQVFVAGDIWLRDKYVSLNDYPFVDFRFEPGPIYSVALIERFMPINKSLDSAVSRLERFFHTMNVGAWLKRQGEQVNISNMAGGQVIEYQGTPPVQAQIVSPSGMTFNFLQLLSSLIEEQGVTTSTLARVPSGVRANAAIESLKESEMANLAVASNQLKKTVKSIAEKIIDLADEYFVTPQTVYFLEKGEPQYFDIIGATALDLRKKAKVDAPEGVVPIKKSYRVDIEVESGLGYTRSGKRDAAKELGEFMIQLAQVGVLPPQAVAKFMESYLETYEFGRAGDIVSLTEKFVGQGGLSENQTEAMKVAIAEVLKDFIKAGILPSGPAQNEDQEGEKPPAESVAYKDLPPSGKVQMAAAAGIKLDPSEVLDKEQLELQMKEREFEMKQREHAMKLAQMEETMAMKEKMADRQMVLKSIQMDAQERRANAADKKGKKSS